MEIEEVEFDFQSVEENQIRPCTDLEKLLNKRYYYGRAGLNVKIDRNLFIEKDEADEIANDIKNVVIKLELGDKMTALEKFAISTLKNSYS